MVVNEMWRLYREGKLDAASFLNHEPEAYFARMSRNGEWVDHLFLQVAGSLLSRDIVILPMRARTTGNGICQILRGGPFSSDRPGTKMPIFMGYFEEDNGSHYQSVSPTQRSKALELVMESGGFDVCQFLDLPGQ